MQPGEEEEDWEGRLGRSWRPLRLLLPCIGHHLARCFCFILAGGSARLARAELQSCLAGNETCAVARRDFPPPRLLRVGGPGLMWGKAVSWQSPGPPPLNNAASGSGPLLGGLSIGLEPGLVNQGAVAQGLGVQVCCGEFGDGVP